MKTYTTTSTRPATAASTPNAGPPRGKMGALTFASLASLGGRVRAGVGHWLARFSADGKLSYEWTEASPAPAARKSAPSAHPVATPAASVRASQTAVITPRDVEIAVAAARQAERARCKAIISSNQWPTRAVLASALAFDTDQSVAVCLEVLASTPTMHTRGREEPSAVASQASSAQSVAASWDRAFALAAGKRPT